MTNLERYQILATVHLGFKNLKKIKAVNHPENKIIGIINDIPSEYNVFNRDTFSIAVLLCQFKKDSSSIGGLAKKLSEISKEDIFKFRDSITNYKVYLKNDIEYLKIKYITPSIDELFKEFINDNIKFYTLYFSILKLEKSDELQTSRIYSIIWKKILGLMVFIRFKEESINNITSELNSIF